MSIEIALIPVVIAVTQSVSSHLTKRMDVNGMYTIETIMKDERILQKALEHYGCSSRLLSEYEVQSQVGDVPILFQRNEQGAIAASFEHAIRIEEAEPFIRNIEQEYTHIVQQETYMKLLERAKEQGLVLEAETVDDHNSIVLTFRVTE
jgi:hypothetical protein